MTNDNNDNWPEQPPAQPPVQSAAQPWPAPNAAPPVAAPQADLSQPWPAPNAAPQAATSQPSPSAVEADWLVPVGSAGSQAGHQPGPVAQADSHEVQLSSETLGSQGPPSDGASGAKLPFRLIALVVGILAFGGIGYAAATGIFGNDTGAASPAEAVDEMMNAMADEDIIAMIESMAPGEVGRLSALYPRFISLAQQEGALTGGDPLAGVDITVEGMVTETVSMHSQVAKVYMLEGIIKFSVNPDELDPSLAELWVEGSETEVEINIAEVRAEMVSAMEAGGDIAEDLAYEFGFDLSIQPTSGLYFMTVEQNGRWYISPYYTFAEMGREILDLPEADFSASRESYSGASSAEGVITGLEDMVNGDTVQGHLDSLLAMDSDAFSQLAVFLPPNEVGVFLDYGPSYATLLDTFAEGFTQEAGMEMQDLVTELEAELAKADVEGQLTLDIVTSTEDIGNGAVKVYLDSGSIALDATATVDGVRESASFTARWNGLCGSAEVVDPSGRLEVVEEECIQPYDISQGDPDLEGFAQEFDRVFVVVNEQNGTWYVSYVETGIEYIDMLLASVEAAN